MSEVLWDCEEKIDKAKARMFCARLRPNESRVSRVFRIHDCVKSYYIIHASSMDFSSFSERDIMIVCYVHEMRDQYPPAFSHQLEIVDIR